jgi:hypothetical protein
MTTDGSPICKYRHCHESLAGRRKGTEFCSSTCRGKHSKQLARGRERDRLRRLLKPATRETVQRFWVALAAGTNRSHALRRPFAQPVERWTTDLSL